MIYKKIPKYKIFRFTWNGQLNFTPEGLKRLLIKHYQKYVKDLKIEEIKKEE